MTTVLTLHRIVDHLEQDHDLTWDSYRRLVDAASASIADLENPSTSRTITMTFDDGTEDHLRAAEELQRRDISAVFFIPAGHVGTPGRMDAGQVHELVSMGHVVGSHGLHHRPLAQVSPAQLRHEVRESRARLEAICGEPVVLFAPPGGIGHEALISTLRSEAYRACRSTRWGVYRDPAERWDIPCVPVTEYTWQRGWVSYVMERHSLPLRMQFGRAVKAALPAELRRSIRKGLHAPIRRARGTSDA